MAERTITANTGKAIKNQIKTTKGDVEGFDRGVWKYMKNQLKLKDADILKMKQARCPAKVNGKAANVFRLFDPEIAKEKGITVSDYEALNKYPELILYEGYRIQGRDGEIVIQKRSSAAASFLEEKIKSGEISDIGVFIEKTAGQKFLSGFGHFLMMGGFMLVLILGVIIAILASVLFKC
jgi:hypothetical protein